ncbi:PREDICTED: 9-cis-epoxycarotenoid dioxygenase NCED3, chloroplastic-like [Erythranthe guttata]|nr:PREDICTED: 9-cis-epoxycarotenoid dioxygenase NCED3, chloroplastic-like [Erythranthe guttata]|eukprot:XP_012847138.1 PREDICTED: 9-cis-epoxycarotenoid dioxygenase NCED3, chloroplastic-like [Erythranthe guttata]
MFVDHAFQFVDQPYLPSQKNFAPVDEIGEAVGVSTIEGCIPDEFPQGVFVRNGANPIHGALKSAISKFGKSSHVWVEGEGMLHAGYLNKNKYVV